MYTENTNLIEYIEQIEAENALLKEFMASLITEAREYQPVKHGRWIETNDDTMKRCTECDVIHLIAQYPHGNANYCPNCGAKMDKEKDEFDNESWAAGIGQTFSP